MSKTYILLVGWMFGKFHGSFTEIWNAGEKIIKTLPSVTAKIKSTIGPYSTIIQISGTSHYWKLPITIARPDLSSNRNSPADAYLECACKICAKFQTDCWNFTYILSSTDVQTDRRAEVQLSADYHHRAIKQKQIFSKFSIRHLKLQWSSN